MALEFSKSEKKHLRQLVSLAWERELRRELLKIGDAIALMRENSMNVHEVDTLIHSHHDGISRDLYQRYAEGDLWLATCYAYAHEILADEDISVLSPERQQSVRSAVYIFKGNFDNDEVSNSSDSE